MRLFRYLTFSNVIAVVALFIALGGAAYAGSKLNGKNIVNASIGGGKLKKETITANKIKKGTITGAQIEANSISSSAINLTTLGTVPTATTAQTATTATTAQTATNATNATTADSATSATTATEADNAKHADEADSAKHADEADTAAHAAEADNAAHAAEADTATHATEADSATNATHATTAGEAESLEGTTAEELTVSCGTTTEFYGGMCWDKTPRPAKIWLVAVSTCGDEVGRLPSIGELIAYVRQEGIQFALSAWSGDIVDVSGSEETVLTSDETERGKKLGSGLLGYRCVFPLTN
jgi:hypothetical protein